MDGLKESLAYAVELSEPHYKEYDGQLYSDKPLERISYAPKASGIEMSTLTSLVDYIKSEVDTMADKMIVHVESPTTVALYSMLDEDRKREHLVKVYASVPDFSFGRYMDHESFLIALQAKFKNNEDRELVLKFAGTVEDGTVAQYGDDGVTQKATVKTGIASKGDAIVPNPVSLIPYRTFIEVEQPQSDFIFRMKSDKYDGIQCAIFEADGGAWKNEAMKNIKEYLKKELEGMEQFTIIS